MSDFHDDVAFAVEIAHETFGLQAEFTNRYQVCVPVSVIVSLDLSDYGEDVNISAETVVLSIQRAQLKEAPQRNETFLISSDAPRAYAGRRFVVFQSIDHTECEYKVLAS